MNGKTVDKCPLAHPFISLTSPDFGLKRQTCPCLAVTGRPNGHRENRGCLMAHLERAPAAKTCEKDADTAIHRQTVSDSPEPYRENLILAGDSVDRTVPSPRSTAAAVRQRAHTILTEMPKNTVRYLTVFSFSSGISEANCPGLYRHLSASPIRLARSAWPASLGCSPSGSSSRRTFSFSG